MIWIIISCSIVIISLLFYIFYPSLKAKLVLNKSNKKHKEFINFSKSENIENKEEKLENQKEDPDTKIDYDNFDLGGLFEEDKNKQTDNDMENEEDNNPYSEKFEEFFNKYIGDNKEENNNDRYSNPFKMRNNDWEDDEINELLRENFHGESTEDLSRQFNDLSDEMKVLLLSNFLDRKE